MDIKVIQTKYGRGIKSNKEYAKGEVITISEGIPLTESQMPSAKVGSPIWAYIFNGLYPGKYILSLDWTSLMNHSEEANITYFPISDTQVKFVALRNIKPGDELNIDYGYDIKSHSESFGINEEKLVNDTQLFDAVGNMSASQGGVDLVKLYSDCIEQDKEGNWRIISNKTGEYWKQKYDSEESAKNALKAYHTNKVNNFDMEQLFDTLSEIKEQLFDAEPEVKTAFNNVVKYFSGKGKEPFKHEKDVRDICESLRKQGIPVNRWFRAGGQTAGFELGKDIINLKFGSSNSKEFHKWATSKGFQHEIGEYTIYKNF